MEKNKKKRSPNYTLDEKQKLLSLVAKYRGIIECKKTGAFFIHKKNEAWAAITKQYNNLCPTMPRNEAMLKHFYNNVKHRARKGSVGKNTKKAVNELLTDSVSMEDDENKNHITDGEAKDPILIDPEHQAIVLLDERIQPNDKPFDEAAECFDGSSEDYIMEDVRLLPERIAKNVKPVLRKNRMENSKTELKKRKTSADFLTKIYLKRKIGLVFHQRRNEIQRYKHEQERQELELKKQVLHIQILKAQLESAEMDLIKKYKINT